MSEALRALEREAYRALRRYLAQPDLATHWAVYDAMKAYEQAWNDYHQEANR